MALGELKNGIGPDAYAIYQQVLAAVVERDHPVGSLYISENATSPAELYGGTWERIEGRFIMGASDTYPAGSTGGEAAHEITIDEMPNHSHVVTAYYNYGWNVNIGNELGETLTSLNRINITSTMSSGEKTGRGYLGTNVSGNGQPHNNIPPYYSVYIWLRIA